MLRNYLRKNMVTVLENNIITLEGYFEEVFTYPNIF